MIAITSADLALLLFTAINSVRVIAYVPQVLRIARDHHGAEAISCITWVLFAVSHLSTIAYALFAVGDMLMVWVFTANLAACVAVLGLTVWKRRGSRTNSPESGRLLGR